MAEAQNVVDRIRRCLDRQNHGSDDGWELARQYAESVERVNERLDRCVSLVGQGLTSEAIHQAELAPPVMEEALALQFDGLEAWTDLCNAQGYTPPPSMHESAVIELDEALGKDKHLHALLCKHRRLALGRVGLKPRIKVLRRLTQCDPDNPIWGEDLEVYEQARHQQIHREARQAADRHDLDRLQSLQTECDEVWLVQPSEQVRHDVAKALADEADRVSRQNLGPIAQRLQAALKEDDASSMRQAISHWDHAWSNLRDHDPQVDQTPAEQVRSRLKQIDHQNQADKAWHTALQKIEHALDEQAPLERLERQWADLLKHERAIPTVIENRYQARQNEASVSASRRFQLIMAGTVGALVLIGATIGGLIYWNSKRAASERWHDQIVQAVDEQHWDSAQTLLGQLQQKRPNLREQPRFETLAQRAERGLTAEANRRKQFAQAISDVEEAGIETPNLEALKHAESLASRPGEKTRVQKLRSAVSRAQRARQKKHDQQFAQNLATLRTRFKSWQKQHAAGTAEYDDLTAIQRNLRQMLGQSNVSETLRKSANPLAVAIGSTLKHHKKKLARRQTIDKTLSDIRGQYHDMDPMLGAMRHFATQFPEHAFTQEFEQVVKMKPAIGAIEAWNTNVRNFSTVRVTNATQAEQRLKLIRQFRVRYAGSQTLNAQLAVYEDYLKRAKHTLGDQTPPDEPGSDANNLLSSPLIDSVWVIRTKEGQTYYTKQSKPYETLGLNKARITYAATSAEMFGRESMSKTNLDEEDLSHTKDGKLNDPPLSAQSQFAEHARKQLRGSDMKWETTHLRLLNKVMSADGIDPILRAALAKRLCGWVADRGWPVPEKVRQIKSVLNQLDTDVAWMSPDDGSVDSARTQIKSRLRPLPSLPSAEHVFAQAMTDLRKSANPRQCVGLIWADSTGQHHLTPKPRPQGPTIWQVPVRRAGQTRLVQLGHTRKGRPVWDRDLADLPVGTPVYRLIENQSTGD